MSNFSQDFKKEDLEKIAWLARLSLTKEEEEKLTKQVKEILEFVGQVKNLADEGIETSGGKNYSQQFAFTQNKNRTRPDQIENESGKFKAALLASAPARLGDWLEVSQVLSKHQK